MKCKVQSDTLKIIKIKQYNKNVPLDNISNRQNNFLVLQYCCIQEGSLCRLINVIIHLYGATSKTKQKQAVFSFCNLQTKWGFSLT